MKYSQTQRRSPALRFLLVLMLIAGIARIATTFAGPEPADFRGNSGPPDAVAFRRSAQLVAVSVGLLVARQGLESLSGQQAVAAAASSSRTD